ncbi:hypothetical protein [Phosphitispora fastidiosa]|uniref:hypothetical protein n=1 Tax=Phosphitispora fastidiosa TaxID=2837202 RepID=UPI001E6321D5|nr:hypothetical protein [Phosphitispora fastidiosa]MBU7007238.1 hypothetical protein [Phosphitispora fastidiosa]
MKKEYCKPELDVKAYAQFENVFTKCNKGNDGPQKCSFIPGWPPNDEEWAAFGANAGS